MRSSNLFFSLAVVAIAVIGINTASAADLPGESYTKSPVTAVDLAYNWSGFYVGEHLGYLMGKTRVLDDGVLTEAGAPTSGVAGGLLAGYNWQSGFFVFGVEQDIGGILNAVGHGVAPPGVGPPGPQGPAGPAGPAGPPGAGVPTGPAGTNTYKINWDGHFLGKAGFAMGQWMLFGTGGVSFAGFNFQEGVPAGAAPAGSTSTTLIGFSVGGGVEYAITRNVLARLQYIYDDFGGHNFAAIDGGTYHVSLTSHTFRSALSWKW